MEDTAADSSRNISIGITRIGQAKSSNKILKRTVEYKRKRRHGWLAKSKQQIYEEGIDRSNKLGTYQSGVAVLGTDDALADSAIQKNNETESICKYCGKKGHKTTRSKHCLRHGEKIDKNTYLQTKELGNNKVSQNEINMSGDEVGIGGGDRCLRPDGTGNNSFVAEALMQLQCMPVMHNNNAGDTASSSNLKMNIFEKSEITETETNVSAQTPVVPITTGAYYVESKSCPTQNLHAPVDSIVPQYIDTKKYPASTAVQVDCDEKNAIKNSVRQETMTVQTYAHNFSKSIESEDYNNIYEYGTVR